MKLMLKLVTLSMLALLALAPAAQAERVYQAVMLPNLVVPPCGEDAWGLATFIVADDGLRATYTVNFAGLEAAETEAFLMHAATGANGPVLMHLPLGAPIAGFVDMSPALEQALTDSTLAIQVSSADHPAGVLRGNFSLVTVASESTTWGSVKALFE